MNSITQPVSYTKKLLQLTNLKVEAYDEEFLNNMISKRVKDLNIGDEETYLQFLSNDQHEKIFFQEFLNIGYSTFFRNGFTFHVLEYIILPQLLLQKRYYSGKQIRIWSTACASGQEPYTLALIMEHFIVSMNYRFNYHIFATDINQNYIDVAKKGVYDEKNIEYIPFSFLKRWFLAENQHFSIVDSIKAKVSFSNFDLLSQNTIAPPESIYGDFDLIMCANLIYYYNEESRNKILGKLKACSNKFTYFLTSEVERDYFIQNNFVEIYPQSAIFQNPKRNQI